MRKKAAALGAARAIDRVRQGRSGAAAASGNVTGPGAQTLRGGQIGVEAGAGLEHDARGRIALREPAAPLSLSPGSPRRYQLDLDEGFEVSPKGRLRPVTSTSVRVVGGALVATPSTAEVTDPTDGTAADALTRVGNELAALDTRIDVLEAAPSGAASSTEVTVDFGTFDTTASTVVTGETWVTATSKLVASVFGTEDALLDQVTVTITDRVAGDGFTVIAHAPNGSSGTHTVHVVGV